MPTASELAIRIGQAAVRSRKHRLKALCQPIKTASNDLLIGSRIRGSQRLRTEVEPKPTIKQLETPRILRKFNLAEELAEEYVAIRYVSLIAAVVICLRLYECRTIAVCPDSFPDLLQLIPCWEHSTLRKPPRHFVPIRFVPVIGIRANPCKFPDTEEVLAETSSRQTASTARLSATKILSAAEA